VAQLRRKFSNGSGGSVTRWLMFILELVLSLERCFLQVSRAWDEFVVGINA
jgi:hypothetical protein